MSHFKKSHTVKEEIIPPFSIETDRGNPKQRFGLSLKLETTVFIVSYGVALYSTASWYQVCIHVCLSLQ
jgi:hypothetical protein